MKGPSWQAWRSLLRVIFCLPLGPYDRDIFYRHTERSTVPKVPPKEVWIVAGRRAGKSRIASLLAEYFSITFDHRSLAGGEVAVLPVIAKDKRQARVIHSYARALTELDPFERYFLSAKDSQEKVIRHHSGVDLEVLAASFRSLRGHTFIGSILDECAFWYDTEVSANPDTEILNAIRPGMATVENSMLIAISSPFAKRGELFRIFERYWGVDDEEVLVINSDTRSLNPTIRQSIVDRAYEEDSSAAAAEFGRDGRVSFRSDVGTFIDADAIRAVTVQDRRELEPRQGEHYYAFADASGGRSDAFTLAISHYDPLSKLAVLDCVRERRPPFSPEHVVSEYANLLRSYHCNVVVGDRYAAEWVTESFMRFGIRYLPSKLSKSELYLNLLPAVNSSRVALLDNPLLRAQLGSLERRSRSGGRDQVDHRVGSRDDLCNAAAGSLVLALPKVRKARKWGFV